MEQVILTKIYKKEYPCVDTISKSSGEGICIPSLELLEGNIVYFRDFTLTRVPCELFTGK